MTNMDNLKKFAVSWTVMWAISYIIVAVVTPWVSTLSPIFYVVLAVVMIVISLLAAVDHKHLVLAMAFMGSAVLMVYGGVTSWTGAFIWNVPFASKELFQVSMAFADFVAAAFMVYLFGETWN